MKLAVPVVRLLLPLFLWSSQQACGDLDPKEFQRDSESLPADAPAVSSLRSAVSSISASSSALTPPPRSCNQRHDGVTAIAVKVQIDQYQGLITGRNGTHEIAYGTIVETPWIYDDSIIDTKNTQLALNVESDRDASGLPHEIKLEEGTIYELQGEYIPSSSANAHDKKGDAAAVIHFAHSPCGFITIGGTTYH